MIYVQNLEAYYPTKLGCPPESITHEPNDVLLILRYSSISM